MHATLQASLSTERSIIEGLAHGAGFVSVARVIVITPAAVHRDDLTAVVLALDHTALGAESATKLIVRLQSAFTSVITRACEVAVHLAATAVDGDHITAAIRDGQEPALSPGLGAKLWSGGGHAHTVPALTHIVTSRAHAAVEVEHVTTGILGLERTTLGPTHAT